MFSEPSAARWWDTELDAGLSHVFGPVVIDETQIGVVELG